MSTVWFYVIFVQLEKEIQKSLLVQTCRSQNSEKPLWNCWNHEKNTIPNMLRSPPNTESKQVAQRLDLVAKWRSIFSTDDHYCQVKCDLEWKNLCKLINLISTILGIHMIALCGVIGGTLGYFVRQYNDQRNAERDAMFRHYIRLHPEDFPPPRKIHRSFVVLYMYIFDFFFCRT